MAHGFCLRSGKMAPSEKVQRELADALRARVSEYGLSVFDLSFSCNRKNNNIELRVIWVCLVSVIQQSLCYIYHDIYINELS